jgi:hypothetical protein
MTNLICEVYIGQAPIGQGNDDEISKPIKARWIQKGREI